MKAVVMGRNFASVLGMVRAAGKAGCEVTVIRTVKRIPDTQSMKNKLKVMLRGDEIDASSRYVKRFFYALESGRNDLVRLLLSECAQKDEKVILLPTDDFTASTVDLNTDVLKESFLFPNIAGRQGAVTEVMNKDFQKQAAIRCGLPAAKGWCIHVQNGTYSIPDDIEFPCFTKPQISFLGDKRCMRRCNDLSELTAVVKEVASQKDCPILVEQFIEFDKEYAILGYSDGENVIMPDLIQMLQSGQGPHRGVTLSGKVSPLMQNEPYYEPLVRFIQSLHFEGLFDIDLFESGGKMYFNELNMRFGASGYAVTASGFNLPQLLIRHLSAGEMLSDVKQKPEIKPAVFVNEKVALDDYENGFITWEQYRSYLDSADIRFIQLKSDPNPYRSFLKRERKIRLVKRAKSLLRREKSAQSTAPPLRREAADSSSSGTITVIEKPEDMSFDVIHSLLVRAHSQLQKDGVHMLTAELTGDQLRERIGNGKCYVATDGGVPVGTVSWRTVNRNRWYQRGETADMLLLGVVPEYAGRHIASLLMQTAEQDAQAHGFGGIELDTADTNTKAIEIYKKRGYVPVWYFAASNKDHYSVAMYKWFGKCPFQPAYCSLRFRMKRRRVRLTKPLR